MERLGTVAVRTLADDLGAVEGPVVRANGDVLVTSLTHHRIYSVSPEGDVTILAETEGSPNGATEGPDGAIFIAQAGLRYERSDDGEVTTANRGEPVGGVQVMDRAGNVTWVTTDLVTPNDLCFGPDGFLYVTDPTRNERRDDGRLWRVDIASGQADLVAEVGWYPNGIAFGLDPNVMYVASTGEARIYAYPVDAHGLGAPEVVCEIGVGRPDGFAVDVEGNLIIALRGGKPTVQIWSADGRLIDGFDSPIVYARNLALDDSGHLFLCDNNALLVVDDWPVAGLPLHDGARVR